MDIRTWARWAALHGAPRAILLRHGRHGSPFAMRLVGEGGGIDTELIEEIRSRGRLVQLRYLSVTADHEICRTILRDKRFIQVTPTNRQLPGPLRWVVERTELDLPNPVEPPAMLAMDPPEHTRYRRLVGQAFTPKAVQKLEERIVAVTDEVLDRLEAEPNPDLIADFAARIPVAIIGEILGVPADQHPWLLQWGHTASPLLDIGLRWPTYRRAISGLREVKAYLEGHLERLRANPTEDVLSHMTANGGLDDRELMANAALLAGAGFETTVNLIGNGIALLAQHPDQLELLRAEPDRWSGAIEEILRYDSPVQRTARTASCDVEIAGEHIPAGTTVALLLAGANRDPGVFADPHRFDVTRENAKEHLTFGGGIHSCLGANLARSEGVTALRTLFDRYPDLRLNGQLTRNNLVTLRGYRSLRATLRPAAALTR